jgi:hypothetical protein
MTGQLELVNEGANAVGRPAARAVNGLYSVKRGAESGA